MNTCIITMIILPCMDYPFLLHVHRNNNYIETAPISEVNNETNTAAASHYDTVPIEQAPTEQPPVDPTYDKIKLTHSLPARGSPDLSGLGYAVPVKRPKLKAPIGEKVVEEEEEDESGYRKLDHTN